MSKKMNLVQMNRERLSKRETTRIMAGIDYDEPKACPCEWTEHGKIDLTARYNRGHDIVIIPGGN